MADTPQRPITPEASEVFGEALISLVQWEGGSEEPTVMLDGQLVRISVVFNHVATARFKDALPPAMH